QIGGRQHRDVDAARVGVIGDKTGDDLGAGHPVLEQHAHPQRTNENRERLDVHCDAFVTERRASSIRVGTLGGAGSPACTAGAAPLGTSSSSRPSRSAKASSVLTLKS